MKESSSGYRGSISRRLSEDSDSATFGPMEQQRINTTLLSIIAAVAVGAVLRLTGTIVLPFVIALLLSFVLSPVATLLERLRIPRILAIVLVVILFLAFGFLIALIVYSSVQSLVREFPQYLARLTALLRDLVDRFDLPEGILSDLDLTQTIGSFLLSISGNFMSFVAGYVVVVIFLLFLLLEKPYLRGKVTQALKHRTTRKITLVAAHINSQIARYMGVKLFVSTLTALIIFVAFSIIGVDFPIIWAILTFMFNFIPSIGSITISIVSIVFAIVQFLPAWNMIFAVAISMVSTQIVIGNILDPQLLGDRLNLSPVVILLALLSFGWLWGVVGMFLAVPLAVAIKIACANIPGLEPIGILMGTGNYIRRKRRRRARSSKTKTQEAMYEQEADSNRRQADG
jgi:predicted PurR-regulated permease PerM